MTSATCTAAGTTPPKHRRAKARGVSTLMYAAQQADVDKIRRILQTQTSSLWDRDRTGKSPLHYCCTSRNLHAAQAADLLVMAAPDLVDNRDEDGFTPLHLAVIAGNMPLVTFLLANNADINAVDNEKHTVVHWATVCGETAALRAVLTAGAPVSTPDVHGGYPLHYAAQMCGAERDSNLGLQVLQTLLTHTNIQVDIADGDGRQPLLWAASAGSTKALLALIRAGSNVEAPDKDGLTALHCAASRGHTDCIDTLLTLCGASPNIIDTNGCTALHYAVTLGHADATALLLVHGADPNKQDRKGRSPAHCGCAKGQFETVKMIASHGANLWLKNARGDFPLHEAATSGRRDLVKWLLEMRPSQVNARNNDGRCPLHQAALNDNADMCKILLDAGAQVNPVLRTSKNLFMTPLDCALQRGFRSTAKYLQLHGGIPASRLRESGQALKNINMRVRDDLTFWGDTSSESEKEDGKQRNRRRMQQRRKLGQEPKVSSLSSSEMDSNRVGGQIENIRSRKKLITEQKIRSGKRSRGKIDYTNEIVINGKTEINIHQSKELSFRNDTALKSEVIEEKSVTEKEVQEKRPKSAKYKKMMRSKSTSASKKIDSKIISKEEKSDLSASTSEETAETIIENHKTSRSESNQKEETQIEQDQTLPISENPGGDTLEASANKMLPDQQSLFSNTSEDVEEHKKTLVEASIHEPPKKSEEEDGTKNEATRKNIIEGESTKNEKTKIEKKKFIEDKGNIQIEESKFQTLPEIKIEDNYKEIKTEEASNRNDNTQESDKKLKKTEASKLERSENLVTINSEQTKEDLARSQNEIKKLQASSEVEVKKIEEKDQNEPNEDPSSQKTEDDREDKTKTKKDQESQDDQEDQNDQKKQKDQEDQKGQKNQEDQDDEEDQEDQKSLEKQKEQVDELDQTPKIQEKTKMKRTNQDQKLINQEEKYVKTKSKTASENIDNKSGIPPESPRSPSPNAEAIPKHKSFRVLNEKEVEKMGENTKNNKVQFRKKSPRKKSGSKLRKQRSRSEESTKTTNKNDKSREKLLRRSKIPTPLPKNRLSKSGLSERKVKSSLESRVPSLPNIYENRDTVKDQPRSESNLSAPLLTSINTDEDRGSQSELEEEEEEEELKNSKSSANKKKKVKVKRRPKNRETHSAGSDYESSNIIDSGFEPSPRSSRIPKCRNMSNRGVNMTTVTRSIQSNIRRYHLERKIFQHLLDLKRLQIRAGRHNEAILVKRAIDAYHQSCASTVGAGRYDPEEYTFKSFEKFLYLALRKLQNNIGAEYLKDLLDAPENPLLCTRSTHRCLHATHAYTGIPCAAYLPQMNHHTIPKIGYPKTTQCQPGTAGFLPNINNPKKSVTLELSHGNDKQVISLPTDRLNHNKRYYVTFTVKGNEENDEKKAASAGHWRSKSD